MTSSVAPELAGTPWRDLLVPGRRYAALPSWQRPVIVADLDGPVRDHVRRALLAAPPGSGVPAWAYAVASQALRLRASWRPFSHTAFPTDASWPDSTLGTFLRRTSERLIVLRHDRDPGAGCVLLTFHPGATQPTYAVKIAGERTGARVEREAARLSIMEGVARASLGGTFPRMVDLLEHGGVPALVTTAQPGVSMFVRYHRPGHISNRIAVLEDLDAAAEWLARAQATPRGPARSLDVPDATVDGLRERLLDQADGEHVLDRLDALRRRLRRYAVRATLVHGDFWPGNVLVDGRKVSGVVDWERAETAGNPVRDLARFALAYCAYLDRHTRPGRRVAGHPALVAGRPAAASLYGIDGSGWFPDMIRRFLRDGVGRLGLPVACARDALLAEVACLLAETTNDLFAREQRATFLALGDNA